MPQPQQPPEQAPYPWDDITPVGPNVEDEIADELGTAALQMAAMLAVVFTLAFGLVYLAGAMG